MFLSEMASVAVRRWYLILAGILLTAVGAPQAAHTPPRYLASQVVVLQPPASPYAPNPLAGLYPSLAITGAAVAERLSTPAAKAQFRAAGVTGSYEFAPRNTGTTQQPRYIIASMTITNIVDDPQSGLRALRLLADAFDRELTALQDLWNVTPRLRITVSTLVPPSATLLPHSASRAMVGAALLGGVSTVAVTFWCDELLRRRRRPRPADPAGRPFSHGTEPLVRVGS